MGTAKATKAADKSQVCRKLVTALQKLYGKSVPKIDLSVVETMLFAACLEDNPWAPAETNLKKILSSYFDLNEVRVSSVSELEKSLAPLKDSDWKGLRIRSILRHVFETTYSYDYEKLRRQTQEQAVKTLKKVNDITPFIRDFILHEILGSHVICLDTSMLTADDDDDEYSLRALPPESERRFAPVHRGNSSARYVAPPRVVRAAPTVGRCQYLVGAGLWRIALAHGGLVEWQIDTAATTAFFRCTSNNSNIATTTTTTTTNTTNLWVCDNQIAA